MEQDSFEGVQLLLLVAQRMSVAERATLAETYKHRIRPRGENLENGSGSKPGEGTQQNLSWYSTGNGRTMDRSAKQPENYLMDAAP